MAFRKSDNAFLAVDDVAALQAAADRFSPQIIQKRNFPIHKIFERSCEIGVWRLTANRISELFKLLGVRAA